MTGHSGRRTGALPYMRSGWAVRQMAHLGRWKSNAILSYAEEALEQLPANMSTWVNSLNSAGVQWSRRNALIWKNWKDGKPTFARRQGQDGGIGDMDQAVQGQSYILAVEGPEFAVEGHPPEPGQSCCIPTCVLERSACGWAFYGSNFVCVSAEAEVTCQKCKVLCAKTQGGG